MTDKATDELAAILHDVFTLCETGESEPDIFLDFVRSGQSGEPCERSILQRVQPSLSSSFFRGHPDTLARDSDERPSAVF